jgi:hypothetical protein
MIEQEKYWRRDLVNFGKRLEKRYRQRTWPSRSLYSIEKEIFVSFYIIRKLIQSGKLTPTVTGSVYPVMCHPIIIGKNPSPDPRTFACTYLLHNGWPIEFDLIELCNQFIHSFIFSPFTPFRRAMLGIYFASDRHSKGALYYITLLKIIEVIISAGCNRLVKLKLRQKDDGTFKVTGKTLR